MAKQIKFTIGGFFGGYNTIEIFIDGEKISYETKFSSEKLYRLPQPAQKTFNAKAWLEELDALKIFEWDKEYFNHEICDGTQWHLTFKDGEKIIYDNGGSNAYPENWCLFIVLINELCANFEPVGKIKFTLGNVAEGYKTVEISIVSTEQDTHAVYKILRSGLLDLDRNKKIAAQMSDDWLKELAELEIFSWKENYSADVADGGQWQLIFDNGREIYRGQGLNAYPENFERFLDWLDALVPELEFVNRKRLEKITLDYSRESAIGYMISECLTIDRREKILTLDKKNAYVFANHVYRLGSNKEKIFDACQNFFDNLEVEEGNPYYPARIKIELVRHDGSIENFETSYNENFLPGMTNLMKEIQNCASDLTAEIFSPSPAEKKTEDKYIFCKVQFKGSYKHYTYRTDDETLSVGDVVDVPVGKNNDVATARIVEIGYFEEYEAPFPVDKIKKIIGKHIADDWENY